MENGFTYGSWLQEKKPSTYLLNSLSTTYFEKILDKFCQI